MSWTQHEIIKKHAVQRICMAVGHLNSVSLFDWQQFWNEVVYLEHLYEEKRMEDWVMAIRGVRRPSGPCLNIKTVFPRYGDSHVKDKTVVRPSYLSPELMHFHWIECPGHLCVIFRIWGNLLHDAHMSYVITNCCQHQWVILYSFPMQ